MLYIFLFLITAVTKKGKKRKEDDLGEGEKGKSNYGKIKNYKSCVTQCFFFLDLYQ